jgi:hypothetical protein
MRLPDRNERRIANDLSEFVLIEQPRAHPLTLLSFTTYSIDCDRRLPYLLIGDQTIRWATLQLRAIRRSLRERGRHAATKHPR